MSDTKIEWANKVWNPVTGCTKVSTGCRNCYAERMSKRLAGRCGYPAENPFAVTLHPERLEEPLRWKKPSRIFVCSMGDLFHEAVDISFLTHVFDMIEACPQHTFLILTKRPDRIKKMMYEKHDNGPRHTWQYFDKGYHPNLWLGTSVEDQRTADERIPLLLQTPAAKRFVSYEPAIGPVDFEKYLINLTCELCGRWTCMSPWPHRIIQKSSIDWIIMGGESGPGARPMHPDWARSTRDQCKAAGTAFFFKQWGEWAPVESDEDDFTYEGRDAVVHIAGTFETDKPDEPFIIDRNRDDALMRRTGKKAAGCLLDGVEHKELPE